MFSNNAVQVIYQINLSVVLTLSDESQNNNNAIALRLHRFVTAFKFCAFLCLLADVLNVLKKICKTHQTHDFLNLFVEPKIVLEIGTGMKDHSGLGLKLG